MTFSNVCNNVMLNMLVCSNDYVFRVDLALTKARRATSNNIKLVHWPLMGGSATGRGRSPLRSLLAVSNVTAHP